MLHAIHRKFFERQQMERATDSRRVNETEREKKRKIKFGFYMSKFKSIGCLNFQAVQCVLPLFRIFFYFSLHSDVHFAKHVVSMCVTLSFFFVSFRKLSLCLHFCVRFKNVNRLQCCLWMCNCSQRSKDETNLAFRLRAAMLIFANKYISFPLHWCDCINLRCALLTLSCIE